MAEGSEPLTKEVFLFHYENLLEAAGRKETYLCYALKGKPEGSVLKYLRNIPRGSPNLPDGKHAEVLFVEDLKALDPELNYQVTCYMSWSPCADCSKALVQFVKQNTEVKLRILASRLYYYKDKRNREGLRSLRAANVSIDIMAEKDFEDCWKLFFDPNEPFQPWGKLKENSDYYIGELQTILRQAPKQPEDDIADWTEKLTLRDAEPTQ